MQVAPGTTGSPHGFSGSVSSPRASPPSSRPRHSPVGQNSPPPRESPRRRDPEVNLDSRGRPREIRLLPGRGRAWSAVAVETAAMAAAGLGGRTAQCSEGVVSAESSVTARTPVSVVSHVSLELPVSPGQVAEPPNKNLWEQICEGRQPGPAEMGELRQPLGGRASWEPSVRQEADLPAALQAASPRARGQAPRGLPEVTPRSLQHGSIVRSKAGECGIKGTRWCGPLVPQSHLVNKKESQVLMRSLLKT